MKIFSTKSKKCLILFEKEIILIFSLKKNVFSYIFGKRIFWFLWKTFPSLKYKTILLWKFFFCLRNWHIFAQKNLIIIFDSRLFISTANQDTLVPYPVDSAVLVWLTGHLATPLVTKYFQLNTYLGV